MTVGILKISLFIYNSNSLKDKRTVLDSLKVKLRNKFNIAVISLNDEDKWQRANLAVVSISKDRSQMDSLLCEVINFLKNYNQIDLLDYEMQIL
ncbi:MAG: DUF503 domain-containing protein [Candidatus Omnitrophica bacterium]|nr:DUF503 domain-containing protein [Candidatus Omnitrophota bacterium]